MNKAPECVIVCQQSVDCGAWPDGACEHGCGQAERAAQAGDELPPPAGTLHDDGYFVPKKWPEGSDRAGWRADYYTTEQMRAAIASQSARLEAAERDAARGRHVINHAGWLRVGGQAHLTVRVADGADLSCKATRELALDAAIAASQEGKG